MVGIQSAFCAPLYRAFKRGKKEVPRIDKKETIAEGIAIAEPVRGRQILEAVRKTKGEILSVTEEEISGALWELGRRGHYIEPTAAATMAGLQKYLKHFKKEVVVSTLTGAGLKATGKISHLSIKSQRQKEMV